MENLINNTIRASTDLLSYHVALHGAADFGNWDVVRVKQTYISCVQLSDT